MGSGNILENRKLWRLGMKALRTMPVVRLGKTVLITRHVGVVDVLARPEDFSVVEIYARKMQRTSGAFFLGMDDTEQYRREQSITAKAIKREDMPRIRTLTRTFAEAAIEPFRSVGKIDVVQQVSRLVPTRLCEEFFGVPGPDRVSLMKWMRYIFHHLFLNITDDETVAQRAEGLAKELNAYLDKLIAERHRELAAGRSPGDDFLTRLLRLQNDPATRLEDEGIRRNVSGVILGSIDTISKSVIFALEELLERPDQFAAAVKAAIADDIDTISAYAFEALRFNPHNPLIVRFAPRDTVVACGDGKFKSVKAGSKVYALTYSAMFDPKRHSKPDDFRADRADRVHLQLGSGMHRCFGEHLGKIEIPEILAAILRLPGLRRASGSEGKTLADGPFPDRLLMEFEPRAK